MRAFLFFLFPKPIIYIFAVNIHYEKSHLAVQLYFITLSFFLHRDQGDADDEQ